jgi:hypothetical protein
MAEVPVRLILVLNSLIQLACPTAAVMAAVVGAAAASAAAAPRLPEP